MARQQQPAHSDKALSRRVLVNIVRDQTDATPRVIWAHEFPILEEIHGEGNIKSIEPETLDEGHDKAKLKKGHKLPSESLGLGYVFVGDPSGEYERLVACYGRHIEDNVSNVEKVYGRFASGMFARILGQPAIEDLPEEQIREMCLAAGYELPQVKYDMRDEQKDAARAAIERFQKMPKPELIKLAAEVGVEVGA